MRLNRLTRSLAIGLTLAAIAAPVAAAGPGYPSRDAHEATLQQDLRNPDRREGAVPGQDLRSPDSRDAADGRGTFNSPEVAVIRVRQPAAAAAPEQGMDWGDAGIGAGTLTLVLLGCVGAFAVVHRRRAGAATA